MQHQPRRSHADPALDAELAAYNLAFSELGLEWHWDPGTYDRIRRAAGERHCVQAYVETRVPAPAAGLRQPLPRRGDRERARAAGAQRPLPDRARALHRRRAMKHATLRQLKIFAVGRAPPELRARRRGAAPHAARRLRADQEARGARRRAALRAGRQEDAPHRRRRRPGRHRPLDRRAVRGRRARDDAAQGRLGRPAQRRRDQRRRLLPAAPAGRVHRPPPGRDAQLHGAQPRGPARAPRRQPDRPRDHGPAAGRRRHGRRAVRAASLRDHRRAVASARRQVAHRHAPHRQGAVRRPRARLRHLAEHARGVRRRSSTRSRWRSRSRAPRR